MATIHYNKAVQIMKDIDTSGGRVAFYFATFDDVDKHGRKMDENAFRRTIKNNVKQWYHLFNHNTSAIVGKVQEAGTDDTGAYVISKLLPTSLGQDLMTMYKEGVVNQHSFGFEINHSVQMANYELVKEVRVHEVSTVTFAANENATTISVNSLMDFFKDRDSRIGEQVRQVINNDATVDVQMQILKKLDAIANALTDTGRSIDDGTSDDIYDFIEKYQY